ncbi:unnamed protein product [Coffea canephora]|uniref:Uncharacterized protein n=1 Tax=Coffea canephora TaxID=49390 RepID=A0A068TVM2_COFCA|nr:unnamed protein product [Coffea canephora]
MRSKRARVKELYQPILHHKPLLVSSFYFVPQIPSSHLGYMAQQVKGNHPTLLIDGDGNFNSKFVEDLKLAAVSRPVAVVSVFGVQSTGKSTLMNSLFSTKFNVMDASQGMHQTTKGIWVAKFPLPNPNGGHEILAIDTEGSDGIEREDDTKFEKQTALFCLAVSNTVIVNM